MVPVVLQVLQKAVPLPLVVLMVLWLAAVRALAAVSAVPTVQAVRAQIVAAVVQRKVAVKVAALAPLGGSVDCGSRLLDLLVEQRERQWRPWFPGPWHTKDIQDIQDIQHLWAKNNDIRWSIDTKLLGIGCVLTQGASRSHMALSAIGCCSQMCWWQTWRTSHCTGPRLSPWDFDLGNLSSSAPASCVFAVWFLVFRPFRLFGLVSCEIRFLSSFLASMDVYGHSIQHCVDRWSLEVNPSESCTSAPIGGGRCGASAATSDSPSQHLGTNGLAQQCDCDIAV